MRKLTPSHLAPMTALLLLSRPLSTRRYAAAGSVDSAEGEIWISRFITVIAIWVEPTPKEHSCRWQCAIVRFKSLQQWRQRYGVQDRMKEAEMDERICIQSVH